ncbi:MAG: hypothetical protein RRY09_00990 [Oscillospiraceae bacterium]
MMMLPTGCETPLPNRCGFRYEGLAFDGCYFYLTCPADCQIIKYDACFCETDSFNVSKPYACICYDISENCFWAATDRHYHKLFKLDTCFNEIDCLNIYPCEDCGSVITGVSFDCVNCRLLISFSGCIVSVEPRSPEQPQLLKKTCGVWNGGVLSLAPSSAVIELCGCNQRLSFYNCHFDLEFQIEIPKCYMLEALIFYPCDIHSGRQRFCALVTKNCSYSFLLVWELPCQAPEIAPCNYDILDNRCCSDRCRPERACCDVIESIALIEAALSHILNAEGEKLQKVIACTDDTDKILAVNRAINETLVNATHLEIILHDKLTALRVCEPICGPDCDCVAPCGCEGGGCD